MTSKQTPAPSTKVTGGKEVFLNSTTARAGSSPVVVTGATIAATATTSGTTGAVSLSQSTVSVGAPAGTSVVSSPTVAVTNSVATVGNQAATTEHYQQSAHKVTIKRYAL